MKKYRFTCAIVFLVFSVTISTACAEKAKLTTHNEMLARLASLETADTLSGCNRLNVRIIGMSVKGKDIPLVTICDPDIPMESTRRLFVICRQHGDEPASTEAMLKLIEDLVKSDDEATADLLKKVSFYIVPMMNPDGADSYVRRNANKADLNRDWLTLSQPETICVRAAIESVIPDVLIDEHELSPTNRDNDFVETAGLASGASAELVAESKQLLDLVAGMLRTNGMANVEFCQVDDQHPARLAHRYFPVYGGTKTFLFETRQAGARQYRLQYRMGLHIVGTMTIAKYLAGQGDELLQRIAEHDAQRRWVQLASRGRNSSGKSAVGRKR